MKRSPIISGREDPRIIAFDGPGYPEEDDWGRIMEGDLHFDEGTRFAYRAERKEDTGSLVWRAALKEDLTPLELDALEREGCTVRA